MTMVRRLVNFLIQTTKILQFEFQTLNNLRMQRRNPQPHAQQPQKAKNHCPQTVHRHGNEMMG